MKRLFAIAGALWLTGALGAGCSGDVEGGDDSTGGSGGSAGDDGGPIDPNCGNGKIDPNEDCDDGNTVAGDGCEPRCKFTCSAGPEGNASCNDFLPCNGTELCSDTHTCLAGAPRPDGDPCGVGKNCKAGKCQSTPAVCGDNIVISPEECEDGNTAAGDGCFNCAWECTITDPNRNCQSTNLCVTNGTCDESTHACVEGVKLPDGTDCGNGSSCRDGACVKALCGNGQVDTGEECDDGNTVAGDGCETTCKWTCLATDSTRNCALGDVCAGTSTCSATTHRCSTPTPKPDNTSCGTGRYCKAGKCTLAKCGNAVVEPGEVCDDGNTNDLDGCKVNCTYTCTTAANCEDGNACTTNVCNGSHVCTKTNLNGTSCTSGSTAGTCRDGVCALPACGNGITDLGEDCDKGSGNGPGTGCTFGCKFECTTAAACTNGNACDGDEMCQDVTGGKTCVAGTPRAAGYVCLDSPRSICDASHVCKPSQCGDNYLDTVAGEQCEPPNTPTCTGSCQNRCDLNGTWALRIETNVSWSGTIAVASGSGKIITWGKVARVFNSTTQQDTGTPCGIVIPDFKGAGGLAGSENYGQTFPDTIFDNNVLPAAVTTFTSSGIPGTTLSSNGAVASLVGLSLSPATQPWPSLSTAISSQVDHDNNNKPGITSIAKSGGSYSLVPVDAFKFFRADRLYLTVRQVAAFNGTIAANCTDVSGTATVSSQDSHVIGCHVSGGSDCNSGQRDFLDQNRVIYKIGSATYAMKKLGTGASCVDVRSALP